MLFNPEKDVRGAPGTGPFLMLHIHHGGQWEALDPRAAHPPPRGQWLDAEGESRTFEHYVEMVCNCFCFWPPWSSNKVEKSENCIGEQQI